VSIAQDWALLGIEPTDDKRAVKLAYGRVLKTIDVDADPAAFVRLREAMAAALEWGTRTPYWEIDGEEEWEEEEEFEGGWDPGANPEALAWHRQLFGGGSPWGPQDVIWGEAYRPALPALSDDALARACAALDRLLFADDAPDEGAIRAAGEAVLTRPELDDLDTAGAVEHWMAGAISASIPRSDPLLEPAISRFGWAEAARGWRRNGELRTVVQRRRDLAFLAQCQQPFSAHRAAVRELLGPRRTHLGLRHVHLIGPVEDLLAKMEAEHPTLEHSFDPDHLAWWRAHLRGRHMPRYFWAVMCLAPFVLTLLILIAFSAGGVGPSAVVVVFPGSVLLSYAAMVAAAELGARTRARQQQVLEGEVPAASGAEWFVAASLVVPALCALLPASGWSIAVAWALALGVANGVALRGLGSSPLFHSSQPYFLPLTAAILSAILLLLLPYLVSMSVVLPLIVASGLSYIGFESVQARLLQAGARRRIALLGAMLLMLAGLVLLFWLVRPTPGWLLMLLPASILAAHLALSATVFSFEGLVGLAVRVAGVVLYFSSATFVDGRLGSGMVLGLSFYGIVFSARSLVLGIRNEVRDARAGG
jgi:hypothetical protein